MGTNYYAEYNICIDCHRRDIIHIGKSSLGWRFNFHATSDLKSYKEWFEFLSKKDVIIIDEYEKKINYNDLFKLINNKQSEKNIQNGEEVYLDSEGYVMCPYEFS